MYIIYHYFDFVKLNGYFDYRRRQQNKYWMYETIDNTLRGNFYNNPIIKQALHAMEDSVQKGEKTSFMAANDLMQMYLATVV